METTSNLNIKIGDRVKASGYNENDEYLGGAYFDLCSITKIGEKIILFGRSCQSGGAMTMFSGEPTDDSTRLNNLSQTINLNTKKEFVQVTGPIHHVIFNKVTPKARSQQ